MESKSLTHQELTEITPNFHWPDKLPLQDVPENYFDHLHTQVMSRIQIPSASKELSVTWTRELPYQLPSQYFENLPDSILEKIKADKTLRALRKKVYSIEQAKTRPKRHRAWKKWAAAAVIIGLLTMAGWTWQHSHQQAAFEKQLATISDNAIEMYLNTQTDLSTSELILSNNISISNKDLKEMVKELNKSIQQ